VLAVAFPIYVVWLLYYFGTFGLTIIGATLIAGLMRCRSHIQSLGGA
jgi:hypothetical protein